jgi:hypothetical protein
MKYGVIVCPKCKKVKAVELKNKSTKCFFCNKQITIKKVKILFKSNFQEEIRNVIGQINEELMNKGR